LFFFLSLTGHCCFQWLDSLPQSRKEFCLFWIRVYSICTYAFRRLITKCYLKLTFCNWAIKRKLTDWILIKRESILPLNHKFTGFFSQMEPGIHASTISSSWSKHNRKITFFWHRVNTVQASNLETCAKTHNFSLKKIKNNKMWAAHHRNFDKQFFCLGKSILPFEWAVCVRYMYNWRYHFFTRSSECFKVAFKQ